MTHSYPDQESWCSTVVVDPSGPYSGVVQESRADKPDARARDAAAILERHGITVPADCPPAVMDEVARMASFVWVDGALVAREHFHIDPADHGLLFGRGLWESTRTFRGVPWLWRSHLERLLGTASLLEIPVAPERLPTSSQVRAFVGSLTTMDVVVRLNVTAGSPGKPGVVWMSAVLPPAPLAAVRLKSVRTWVSAEQPHLVWKTFQYGGRLHAAQQARQAGYDNALLLDAHGHALEAANANLFARLPDGWVTPPAAGELLPGTVRGYLLARGPFPIREENLPRAALVEAREVFVTNSNVGIVPVTQIDEVRFPIGPETQRLRQRLFASSANEE